MYQWMPPKVPRAFTIDNDDTLLSTFENGTRIILETVTQFGFNSRSQEEIKPYWGIKLRELIRKLWPKMNETTYAAWYRVMRAQEHVQPPPPIPGVHGAIEELGKIAMLAIVTSRSKDSFPDVFSKAGFRTEDFIHIQTGGDSLYEKSDGRVFGPAIATFARNGINRSQVAHIGDSLYDLEGACDAGIGFIPVLSGTTTRREFMDAGVPEELIVPDITHVLKLLTNTYSR